MTIDRAALAEFALSLVGLTADTAPSRASCRERYLAAIAPGETPAMAAQMARMSGCALVALRGYLAAFIKHPIVSRPYVIGHAVSDLVTVGREAHAIREPGDAPEVGDVVIVGGGTDGGGSEHAWIFVEGTASDAYGVDGGHFDVRGFQSVIRRPHAIREGWDSTSSYRRKVRFVLDAVAICEAFPR